MTKKLSDFLAAFGRWLLKQRPDTVLLFCLVGLVAFGLHHLPGALMNVADRYSTSFERIAERNAAAYEADQERDQRMQALLLERIAAERRAGEKNLVGHP